MKTLSLTSLALDAHQLNLSVWGNDWGKDAGEGTTATAPPFSPADVPAPLLAFVQTKVNAWAMNWIEHMPKCPYAPEPPLTPSHPPNYRDWTSSRLLGLLNTTLSKLSDDDVNGAIDAALTKWASIRWKEVRPLRPCAFPTP